VEGDESVTETQQPAGTLGEEGKRLSRLQRLAAKVGGGVVVLGAGAALLAYFFPRTPPPPPADHTGWVLMQPGLDVRQSANLDGNIVGSLQYGTKVYIVCTKKGTPVTGPASGAKTLTTAIWDYVRIEPSARPVGFVPDAWINTGTTTPQAAAC